MWENTTETDNAHGDFDDGDIMGLAIDVDAKKCAISNNGGWWSSTTEWAGSSPDWTTYHLDLSSGGFSTFHFYMGESGSSATSTWLANFGNPPYANSSSVADGNGYGAFEYAPPSGYLALCTKNLGSDGG